MAQAASESAASCSAFFRSGLVSMRSGWNLRVADALAVQKGRNREVGQGARTSPQPHFGIQAARALVLGPELGPGPAGRLLERCVAAWAAASEATLSMLWRFRRLVLARAILAARPLRRAW